MIKAQTAKEKAIEKYSYHNGYSAGHKTAFDNLMALAMFAIMEQTRYRENGMLKIWKRIVDISEATELGYLSMYDIKLTLAEEVGLVCDETDRILCKIALDRNNGIKDGNYKAVVSDAMQRYEKMIEEAYHGEQE